MKVTEDGISLHENDYLKKVRLFDSVDDTTSENTLTTHESTIPRNVKGIRLRGVPQKLHQDKEHYSRRETFVSSTNKQSCLRVVKSVPPRAPGVVKQNKTHKTSTKVRNERRFNYKRNWFNNKVQENSNCPKSDLPTTPNYYISKMLLQDCR
ncbi:hypothetical protein AHF37_08865 [Paragonimus kellicotti]|nr:hypothetical protein AHF37_08865 [Paragonimus kellicotti]